MHVKFSPGVIGGVGMTTRFDPCGMIPGCTFLPPGYLTHNFISHKHDLIRLYLYIIFVYFKITASNCKLIVETIFASLFVCFWLTLYHNNCNLFVSFVSCLPLISSEFSHTGGILRSFLLHLSCLFLFITIFFPKTSQFCLSSLSFVSSLFFLNRIPSSPLLCLSSIFHSDNHAHLILNTTEFVSYQSVLFIQLQAKWILVTYCC